MDADRCLVPEVTRLGWQDKSREVRGCGSGVNRRNFNSLFRCTDWLRWLRLPFSLLFCWHYRTSRERDDEPRQRTANPFRTHPLHTVAAHEAVPVAGSGGCGEVWWPQAGPLPTIGDAKPIRALPRREFTRRQEPRPGRPSGRRGGAGNPASTKKRKADRSSDVPQTRRGHPRRLARVDVRRRPRRCRPPRFRQALRR